MDDDGLIVRVAAGDDTARRELFCRHAPWVAARLRVVLPAADVEDVLQETFLAVWKGAGGYRPGGSVGGWGGGVRRRPGGRGRWGGVGERAPAGGVVPAPPGPSRAAVARRGRGGRTACQ